MEVTELTGLIATTMSVLYMGFGVPAQILKNYKNRSVEGISFFMCVMLFLMCCSWLIYSLLKPDYFVFISNVPGFFAGIVILYQFYVYGKK